MDDHSKNSKITKRIDTQEFELPETHYVRDIENKVFQGIVLQCLSNIDGIALVEGNFIDNIFSKTSLEGVKGIAIEQDSKNSSVGVKIDVNICYGYSIPEKAEEIQALCSDEITKLTGLHVSYVHVVFKSVVLPEDLKKSSGHDGLDDGMQKRHQSIEEEYSDEF